MINQIIDKYDIDERLYYFPKLDRLTSWNLTIDFTHKTQTPTNQSIINIDTSWNLIVPANHSYLQLKTDTTTLNLNTTLSTLSMDTSYNLQIERINSGNNLKFTLKNNHTNVTTTETHNYSSYPINIVSNTVISGGHHSLDLNEDFKGEITSVKVSDLPTTRSQFRVNSTTTGAQINPCVAALNNDDYVVVWNNDNDIYAKHYNANGTPLATSAPFDFKVNSYTSDIQSRPSITGLTGGGYVVVWNSQNQDGDGYGIYARIYNASSIAGTEFIVNSTTTSDQLNPIVNKLDGGGFIVVWQSVFSTNYEIRAKRYDSSGNAQVIPGYQFATDTKPHFSDDIIFNTSELHEFRANSYSLLNTSSQIAPSVSNLRGGGFVIAWSSLEQDIHDTSINLIGNKTYGIYAKQFDQLGRSVVRNTDNNIVLDGVGKYEFLVNDYLLNQQVTPNVVGLPDGNFVISWLSYRQGSDKPNLFAKQYDINNYEVPKTLADISSSLDGSGNEFRLNTTTDIGEDNMLKQTIFNVEEYDINGIHQDFPDLNNYAQWHVTIDFVTGTLGTSQDIIGYVSGSPVGWRLGIGSDKKIIFTPTNDFSLNSLPDFEENTAYHIEIDKGYLNTNDYRIIVSTQNTTNILKQTGDLNMNNPSTPTISNNQYYAFTIGGNYDAGTYKAESNSIFATSGINNDFAGRITKVLVDIRVQDHVNINRHSLTSLTSGGYLSSWISRDYFTGEKDVVVKQVDLSGQNIELQSTNTINMGEWENIIITYDDDASSNQLKMYKGGLLSQGGQTSVKLRTDQLAISNTELRIGKGHFDKDSDYFHGHMFEFRIYNTALTASDVSGIYNNAELFETERVQISMQDIVKRATGTLGVSMGNNS